MKKYYTDEGRAKSVYFRSLPGKSLAIFQIVFFDFVLSLSRNKSWSNGNVHGWRVEVLKRGNCNL